MRILILFTLMSSLCFAAKGPERRKIRAGTEVSITNYFADPDAAEITMTKEEAVGPNYASIESLKAALRTDQTVAELRRQIRKNPTAVYVLRADLPLLLEQEVYLRTQKK